MGFKFDLRLFSGDLFFVVEEKVLFTREGDLGVVAFTSLVALGLTEVCLRTFPSLTDLHLFAKFKLQTLSLLFFKEGLIFTNIKQVLLVLNES